MVKLSVNPVRFRDHGKLGLYQVTAYAETRNRVANCVPKGLANLCYTGHFHREMVSDNSKSDMSHWTKAQWLTFDFANKQLQTAQG